LVQAIFAAYVLPTPGGPVNRIDLARNPDVAPERPPDDMAALANIRTDLIISTKVIVAPDWYGLSVDLVASSSKIAPAFSDNVSGGNIVTLVLGKTI